MTTWQCSAVTVCLMSVQSKQNRFSISSSREVRGQTDLLIEDRPICCCALGMLASTKRALVPNHHFCLNGLRVQNRCPPLTLENIMEYFNAV